MLSAKPAEQWLHMEKWISKEKWPGDNCCINAFEKAINIWRYLYRSHHKKEKYVDINREVNEKYYDAIEIYIIDIHVFFGHRHTKGTFMIARKCVDVVYFRCIKVIT